MTQKDKLIQLFGSSPILRSRDITHHGIDTKTIQRMVERQELVKVARGLYSLPGLNPASHYSLIQAQHIVPNGVICLLSALYFHEIGTQSPRYIHIAIRRRSRIPSTDDYPIQIYTFSGAAFTEGIEEYHRGSSAVRVYSPAKTVADCFKFRGKIGIDVAVEALKDVAQTKKATVQDILHFAHICRVKSVMQPYMEAVYS